jgi:hypothetical protein
MLFIMTSHSAGYLRKIKNISINLGTFNLNIISALLTRLLVKKNTLGVKFIYLYLNFQKIEFLKYREIL